VRSPILRPWVTGCLTLKKALRLASSRGLIVRGIQEYSERGGLLRASWECEKAMRALTLQGGVDAKRLTARGVGQNSTARTRARNRSFVVMWHERHACRARDALPQCSSSMGIDFTILDVIDAG